LPRRGHQADIARGLLVSWPAQLQPVTGTLLQMLPAG
jgi:hypothetical protein